MQLLCPFMLVFVLIAYCRIVTVNLAVLPGVQQGVAWFCDAARPNSDVWKRMLNILHDIGILPLVLDAHPPTHPP